MSTVLISIIVLLAPCAYLIYRAATAPEIGQPEELAENDSARADVIIEAWLKPTRKAKASV